ncbi:hypothetical protein JRI60_33330 [Archangium violaceum]|uniref:hypothetical protein n=1 Tax=Archangium violaceum TaxID=83451 RepID=UPI00194E970F|nr:hypothetical protein [Archangium violaceum]QRN94014.1 hypothetical protein JRI60_33330 [Archangium violaceum]
MSTIKGLTGPRVPTSSPSAAREAPRTSFISRVQAGASGAVNLPRSGAAVSGRDIVSSAIDSAKQSQSSNSAVGSEFNGEMQAMFEQQQQLKAIKEMSRSFLMGTMQGLFQGFGEGPKIEQE